MQSPKLAARRYGPDRFNKIIANTDQIIMQVACWITVAGDQPYAVFQIKNTVWVKHLTMLIMASDISHAINYMHFWHP